MSINAEPRWRRSMRSQWVVPAVAVVLGAIGFAAQAARGDVGDGVVSLAIMVVFALVLTVFSTRSETVSLLRGDTPDERAGTIQIRASAVTGMVLVWVLVIGFLVELARGGGSLEIWSGLCCVGGVTFAASLLVLSRTS